MTLRDKKEVEDLKSMRESSRLYKPPKVDLAAEETINKMLPMSPEEGPPLPKALGIKWPWKK